MLVEILLLLTFISICILIYQVMYGKSSEKRSTYLKEFNKYILRLNENKTKALKRIDNYLYVEYGINKYLILSLDNQTFKLVDDKINKSVHSTDILPFKFFNNVLVNTTLQKYKDFINNSIEHNGSMLDKRTYNLMKSMIDITKNTLEHYNLPPKSVKKQQKQQNLNIDDILDRINKVGYDELTDEEKQFLKNYNQ